jgi:hypothetical protein
MSLNLMNLMNLIKVMNFLGTVERINFDVEVGLGSGMVGETVFSISGSQPVWAVCRSPG